MNCRKARKWISMEMDGELPREQLPLLEEHLGACENCRNTRAAWTGYSAYLGELPEPIGYSPETALADVRRALRAGTGKGRAPVWHGALRPAWAAVFLVLIGSTFLWYRFTGGRDSANSSNVAYVETKQTRVEWVETDIPNAMSMVFEDAETGLTVIWVDAPEPEEAPHAGS